MIELLTIFLIFAWIIIGMLIGIKYGDLWTMFITVPMCMFFGPLSYIYYRFFSN